MVRVPLSTIDSDGPLSKTDTGRLAWADPSMGRASFGAINIRACRWRRVGDGPDPLLAPALASMIR